MDGLSRALLAGAVRSSLGAAFVALRAPGRAESRANAGRAFAQPASASSTALRA